MVIVYVVRVDHTGETTQPHVCRTDVELARVVARVKADQVTAPTGTNFQLRIKDVTDTPQTLLAAFTSIETYLLIPAPSISLRRGVERLNWERYGVTHSGLIRELEREYPAGFRALCATPRETQERIVTATRERLEREFQATLTTSGQQSG